MFIYIISGSHRPTTHKLAWCKEKLPIRPYLSKLKLIYLHCTGITMYVYCYSTNMNISLSLILSMLLIWPVLCCIEAETVLEVSAPSVPIPCVPRQWPQRHRPLLHAGRPLALLRRLQPGRAPARQAHARARALPRGAGPAVPLGGKHYSKCNFK